MSSSNDGLIQLFYDLGDGLSEDFSVTRPLKQTKKFRTYKFHIPPGQYKQIRLDPSNQTGEFKIGSVRIIDRSGHVMRTWKPTDFVAANQIQLKEIQSDLVIFQTDPGAYDPTLMLLNSSFKLKAASSILSESFYRSAFYWVLTILICIGLFYLAKKYTSLTHFLSALPKASTPSRLKVLAVASVLIALASIYPIVFFNRSFVSPLNGPVALLYPAKPWVPDFKGSGIENVRASDVGAMAWEFLPYSREQHKAIFKDRELPLWYSSNSAGIPLLGQGLSMIGDPLHWLVVAFDGSAWAWDLKYVLSRISFVFAVGLGVFLATRSLAAALVVSSSAAFIGFFSYRFNHSANFGFCHAAWILAAWIAIITAKSKSSRSLWIGILILSTLMCINSGTVKEAYILAATLNLCGVICMIFSLPNLLARTFPIMIFAGVSLLLIAAPFWLTFLYTLKQSVTLSDALIPPQLLDLARLAGLFDDIFFTRLQNSLLFAGVFSANALIMGAALWGVLNIKLLKRERLFIGLLASAAIPFALVFLSTPEIIHAIPFIRHVGHITDTFLCGLLIQIFILAGFGVRSFIENLKSHSWFRTYWFYIFALGIILGYHFYASISEPIKYSPAIPSADFQLYIIIVPLIASMLMLPLLIKLLCNGIKTTIGGGCIFAMILYALLNIHGRYGMHLETGNDWLDYLRANPGKRADLSAKSEAIESLKKIETEPFRVVGSGPVLFPGFQGYYGLEAINGPDPLMNPYYRELMPAMGFDIFGGWTIHVDLQSPDSFAKFSPGLDLLNVRYVLSYPGALNPRAGLTLVGSHDLNVYKRETAWPRAYFSSKISQYNGVGEFAKILRQSKGKPIAAIQRDDPGIDAKVFALTEDVANQTFVPAHDFKITTNKFNFSIDAPSQGVAVLSNSYYRDAFEVTINGVKAPYFRVNHAFMGVAIPEKGTYQITFEYKPWYWKLSLILSAFGFISILLLLVRQKDL